MDGWLPANKGSNFDSVRDNRIGGVKRAAVDLRVLKTSLGTPYLLLVHDEGWLLARGSLAFEQSHVTY